MQDSAAPFAVSFVVLSAALLLVLTIAGCAAAPDGALPSATELNEVSTAALNDDSAANLNAVSATPLNNVSAANLNAVSVVVEDSDSYTVSAPAKTIARGGDVSFLILPKEGQVVTACDYTGDYELSSPPSGAGTLLTLRSVNYDTAISLSIEQQGIPLRLVLDADTGSDPNDSSVPRDSNVAATPKNEPFMNATAPREGEVSIIYRRPSHLRINTPGLLEVNPPEGRTLLGWSTNAVGSADIFQDGLDHFALPGSRIKATADAEGLTLYAVWSEWTDSRYFETESDGGSGEGGSGGKGEGVAITGCTADPATTPVLTIPAAIDGKPVTTIAAKAFENAPYKAVILPASLRNIHDDAFLRADLERLFLYDSIERISDRAFSDCGKLAHLYIGAATAPRYSGTYYDTFPDKMDYLMEQAARRDVGDIDRLLVLFSGSSTRFGYDSKAIEAAFPGTAVANMGVFAYTNALSQLDLILPCLRRGDILLDSPEFDAAKRQFCTSASFDDKFYNMIEGNYSLLARLDLRRYQNVFNAFSQFLSIRRALPALQYGISAKDYDEDGNPVTQPSYNENGDYIVYRANADSDAPVYGLPLDYTVNSYPEDYFLAPANEEFTRFTDRGVRVFFTYAPRNRLALSKASTKEAIAALDQHFRDHLSVPVISSIEDSLYPGRLFYGTDNHLSTEGVQIRTERVIRGLKRALEEGL